MHESEENPGIRLLGSISQIGGRRGGEKCGENGIVRSARRRFKMNPDRRREKSIMEWRINKENVEEFYNAYVRFVVAHTMPEWVSLEEMLRELSRKSKMTARRFCREFINRNFRLLYELCHERHKDLGDIARKVGGSHLGLREIDSCMISYIFPMKFLKDWGEICKIEWIVWSGD